MLARMTAQTNAIVGLESEVKQMLDSEGVPVMLIRSQGFNIPAPSAP